MPLLAQLATLKSPVQANSQRELMDAQRIAVDAIVVLTGCDREKVAASSAVCILSGSKDLKRLTFKGLQVVRA